MNIKEINRRLAFGLMSVAEAQAILDIINMGSDTAYYVIENEKIVKQ